ncbi:hypothetical protein H6P81_012486 [Aristolochia fimbriata]|uniref:Uncharacterized protein n=1 Tax=Aristolochia fimbriata TaxID=158543 RepID=A0AAV7EGK9_ARIFI|nr:hypothetical protein H6P81_012486 [Aristolochia fimbriata]
MEGRTRSVGSKVRCAWGGPPGGAGGRASAVGAHQVVKEFAVAVQTEEVCNVKKSMERLLLLVVFGPVKAFLIMGMLMQIIPG